MNKKYHAKHKFTSVFMTLVLIITFLIPTMSATVLKADAAVKIKTQAAANSYLKKGAIKGIDVSKWQGGINWKKVAGAGVKFAFIRSSYGTDTDPYFVSNAQAAHRNGVKVGAYHYARFKSSKTMKSEAAFFISQLKKVDITYPVVLDLENHYGLSKKNLTTLALQFINIVEKEGYSVMLYSYQNFIDQRLLKKSLAKTSMWVANYQKAPQNISHDVWQHTSSGKVSGISGNVDINIAYKDMSVKKGRTVNRTISNSIQGYLNDSYGLGLPTDGTINMTELNKAIMAALQRELSGIVADGTIIEDGVLTSDNIRKLAALDLTVADYANVLKLLQIKLFYAGYYTEEISGVFDQHTRDALNSYQTTNKVEKSTAFSPVTIASMFKVKLTEAAPPSGVEGEIVEEDAEAADPKADTDEIPAGADVSDEETPEGAGIEVIPEPEDDKK